MIRCLGVLREPENSPQRVGDDALVLRKVLEQLELLGVSTRLATPEEFDRTDITEWDVLLPMCEAYPRLKRLKAAAASWKGRMINRAEAALNCYRTSMAPLLASCPGVRFPPSELYAVSEAEGAGGDFPHGGRWVKRGDVHNTCERDVVFARTGKELRAVLEDFSIREITHYLLQSHVEGELIKFYGVGPGRWFTWFYHEPSMVQGHEFSIDELAQAAAAAARRLGLEVFGGDAIVGEDGSVSLIDINSWPSFARVRSEAAVQIAWHVHSSLRCKLTL